MKTTRSRMLLVFVAAAIIVTLFMKWETIAPDILKGFRDGYLSAAPEIAPAARWS
jgi:hypothetical protein